MEEYDIYGKYPSQERLCIIYTHKCTAKCGHCSTESSPERNAVLGLTKAREFLDAGIKTGRKLAIISGGEVFLYYDELKAMVEYAARNGLETLVETNAFWASDSAIARKYLAELQACGLTAINTSADVYHEPFVPFNNILNFSRAAAALAIPYMVCFTYSEDAKRDREILRKLEEEGLCYSKDWIFPFGRARNLASPATQKIDISGCRDCGDLVITIMPEGEIVSCCNINIHKKGSPLYLGDADTMGMREIFEREKHHILHRLIRKRGFGYIYRLLSATPDFSGQFVNKRYATVCDFCYQVFCDPAIAQYLQEQALKEVRKEYHESIEN